MKDGNYEWEELDEIPDEYWEEVVPEEDLKEMKGLPEVWWAEEIEKIEDPEIREREIEAAEKIMQKGKALRERLESGELTAEEYWGIYESGLSREERKAATRSGLASTGLTYDHLGDLSEDYDILVNGDLGLAEKKARLKKMIEVRGPEASQELADRMLKEGEISEKTHETISRQVRLHGK